MEPILEEQPLRTSHAITLRWRHDHFRINHRGQIYNRQSRKRISGQEIMEFGQEILTSLIGFVHRAMVQDLAMVEQSIPSLEMAMLGTIRSPSLYAGSLSSTTSSELSRLTSCSQRSNGGNNPHWDPSIPRCIFHTSSNYSVAEKLLVFVCSSRGSSSGVWSRSLLLRDGLHVGSMLPYFKQALRAGYGVIVMNPNMNTQEVVVDGVLQKLPIPGSSSQEEHVEHVFQNYIFPSAAHRIHFLAYGYGGVLLLDLIDKHTFELRNRLGNLAFIESSHRRDAKWSPGFAQFFSQRSICWRSSRLPLNTEIEDPGHPRASSDPDFGRRNHATTGSHFGTKRIPHGSTSTSKPLDPGCLCLSAGNFHPSGHNSSPAYSTVSVKRSIFEFFDAPNAYEFHRTAMRRIQEEQAATAVAIAAGVANLGSGGTRRRNGSHPSSRRCAKHHVGNHRAATGTDPSSGLHTKGAHGTNVKYTTTMKNPNQKHDRDGMVQVTATRLDKLHMTHSAMTSSSSSSFKTSFDSLTIEDFELLRVVGKGAFGKVMLVRRKRSFGASGGGNDDKVYAMKVIKKAAVFAKHQVEHTKTERRILQDIDHPFMVKLRCAFQNESKLYFVMDYYNGGTLHFHLRRSQCFNEPCAKFYAAQIVLALSHLHSYNIVYRDLKVENILMDDGGFIALTDFGLSRDNYDPKHQGGLRTFCGTPEYIAPELIQRIPYGKEVDFWSLGILIYQMIDGTTPFYHPSRQKNFENILKQPLEFNGKFSENAKSLLRGLLMRNPHQRLGTGPCGINEIKDHVFFQDIHWEKLYKRQVAVPFKPVVNKPGELGNVAEYFTRQQAIDSVVQESLPCNVQDAFENFTYTDPVQMEMVGG